MSSHELAPASRRALTGLFAWSRGLDEERARRDLAVATDAPRDNVAVGSRFGVAQAGARVHRRGDVVCAVEGRLLNGDALASRLGCLPDAAPAEIVAGAYARLGEGALAELRGEFAIALWDAGAETGFLARDQLGGRSLFVHSSGARLAFASDVKWLLRLLPQRPPVDEPALVQWLTTGGATAGRTLYSGIRRLEPGTMIRLSRGGWSETVYWRPQPATTHRLSPDEAAAELRAAIARSVAARVKGKDVVAVALSGGVDSSTVAAVARETFDGDLVAYSMTFPEHPSVDESELIRGITRQLGIPAVEMRVAGGSWLARALELMELWELPTPVANVAFTPLLHQHAVENGIDVILDGEGGDELFSADAYLPAALLRSGRWLAAWRICHQLAGYGDPPSPRYVRRAFVQLGIHGALPYSLQRLRRSLRRPEDMAPIWCTSAAARVLAERDDPWTWKRRPGPAWWAHLADMLTANRERHWAFDYMRQLAAVSGIEGSHPLHDLDLVEFMLRMPPEYAWDPKYDRALVRKSMSGRLPDAVRLRTDKTAFNPLLRDSLFGPDLAVARRLLESPTAETRAYVDQQVLGEHFDAARSGADPAPFAIGAWRLLLAECWLRSQANPDFSLQLRTSLGASPVRAEFVSLPATRPTFFQLDRSGTRT